MEVIIIFSQGSKQANRLIDNRLRLRTISGEVSKYGLFLFVKKCCLH